MYPKAEILFPFPVARKLRNLRSEKWAELVDRVSNLPETDPDALAFILMMIRINNCLKCYSGSYKFMRGCEACSIQGVQQFKGEDEDLIALFEKTKQALEAYLAGEGPAPTGVLEMQFQAPATEEGDED
ncbi:MAG TPA: hypothetical protein G4O05_07775 [Caldilineae bacterium]|nr:hypothetical protein [Caldilineae bacterium]HIQ12716.1 hypothetical protein [Caldilineales bacterium]